MKVLNRIITWEGFRGITYEADPRHVEIVVEQLGLEEAKFVLTPGTKEEGRTQVGMERALSSTEASKYRVLVARCVYLSLDRPDASFSVKECSRRMSQPTVGDWYRRKRLGRYLAGRPRLQQVYEWQPKQSIMTAFTDADWAGCRATRKSTTGGCIIVGGHMLKGWSKTQFLVALSSAESELYAALRSSVETLECCQ